jgi:predicted phage tail protein
MKKFNPFFVIGSVGIIITAVLHMVFALVLEMPFVHNTFWVLYPTFISFMAIGVAQLLKLQPKTIKNNNG